MINSEKIKDFDSHWKEVMKLAEKYGFITYAHGGTAVLATQQTQFEIYGEEKYLSRQSEVFRINMAGDDND